MNSRENHSNKVLMIIAQYFPIIGGAEQQAHRLARELIAKGCEVTILTGRWHRSTPRREVVEGVPVIRHSTGWEWMWKFRFGHVVKHYVWELSLLLHLLVRGRGYQVLHVHQALHAAFVTLFANRFLRRKVIVKIGCGGELSDVKMMQQNRVSPFGRIFWRFIRRCDRMVAINREIAVELLDDGFSPEKVVRIPNGFAAGSVPSSRAYEGGGPLRAVSVGRLDPQKAFDVLIDGFAHPACPDVLCEIFGGGREEPVLRELIRDRGVEDRIVLSGIVNDVVDRLRKKDVFVLVSRAEGLSNALLEAMAQGLPCIASNIGGNTDLLSPQEEPAEIPRGGFLVVDNGVLVNRDDPEGLALALRALANDERLRANLGCSAQAWVTRHCSLEHVASRYLDLYKELLAGEAASA